MISPQPPRIATIYPLISEVIPSAVEPIGIADYINYNRIQISTDQQLLQTKLIAARQWVESRTGRSLVLRTVDQIIDKPPMWDEFVELRCPPIRKVVSGTIWDTYGNYVVVDPKVYVQSTINDPYVRIMLAYATVWPQPYRNFESLRFRTIVGYLTPVTDVSIIGGTLVAPGHPYIENQPVRLSVSSGNLPFGFSLLKTYYVFNALSDSLMLTLVPGSGSPVIPQGKGTGQLFLGEMPVALKEAILTLAASELFESELSEEGQESVLESKGIPPVVTSLLRPYIRLRF